MAENSRTVTDVVEQGASTSPIFPKSYDEACTQLISLLYQLSAKM